MQEQSIHRHGFVFGALMLCAAVITASFVFFPKGSVQVAEASQACPFTDGDGGTAGIQVTVSPSAIAAVPTPGDYYDCTASDVTIKSGVTVTLNSDIVAGTYAEIHFSNLIVESTAIIDANGKGCTVQSTGPTSGNVCATVGSGGQGAGVTDGGNAGGGGGHGGAGGRSGDTAVASTTYDSATAPVLFGAAGGGTSSPPPVGAGGGVIRLDIGGTFTQNGTVRANGTDGGGGCGAGGGGAGGSIYVTAATMASATGVFNANGGGGASASCRGGGGGGGRISLVYASGSRTFTASDFTASGGSAVGPATVGAKGSAYTKNTGANAVAIFHGFSYEDSAYSVTSWTVDSSATNEYCTGTVTPSITASTSISIAGSLTCAVTNTAFTLTSPSVSLAGTINMASTGSSMTITSSSGSVSMTGLTYSGAPQKLFTLSGGPSVTVSSSSTITANLNWVTIASLNVDSTSILSANGLGCTVQSTGPTSGNVCATAGSGGQGTGETDGGNAGGGGGHGGAGGHSGNTASGGGTYDSAVAPLLFGSAGGGTGAFPPVGAGGGVIRIDITGAFTQNGTMRVNGTDGSGGCGAGGGGAGGSIYVTASTMASATGVFNANGGNGGSPSCRGGGGGGGRISLVYASGSRTFTASDFTASGGTVVAPAIIGDKGSVYTKNTGANTVAIFHGFSYEDTAYSVTSWTVDSSATNQYCTGTVTPSITASTSISIAGSLTCAVTNTAFTLTSPSVSLAGTINMTGTGSSMTITSSSGVVSMTGLTYAGVPQKYLTISGGPSVTVSSSSTVTANLNWVTIASLNVDSTSILSANGLGCTVQSTGPTSGNVCATAGSGGQGAGNTGTNNAGGGGGHGGAGGASGDGTAPGGSAYDSSTAPVLFGAAGGSFPGNPPVGAGGGVIRIDIAGTFTQNGTVRANGTSGGSNATGGGAGGAIYVTMGGSYTCSTAPTWSALGGIGVSPFGRGGGGGGGRISVTYAGSDTCAAQHLSSLSAATVTAGGSAVSPAVAGSTGTVNQEATNPPPMVTVVTHSPSNPSQTDAVTLSGTATDSGGVTSIQIYLDGTAPGNLKKTCTQSPSSPVTCTVNVGALAYGSHTTTIRASDGTNTTDGAETFNVTGPTSNGATTLSRLAAGATATFSMSFTFQSGTHSGPLTVTFPATFTLNSAPTGTSGCLSAFAFNNTAHTLSATKTNCTGTITLAGASITNPGTPGNYTISWVNDDPGSTIVAIVDSDTVSMSATVDPFLTVNIGSQSSATACDGTFAGAGGAFALGALSTGSVTSSDASSVPHICLRVSTNASSGAVATVKSLNGNLKSTSTPADTIPSNGVTLTAGTAGYGLCVGSAGGDTGLDTTVPTGASPTRTSPFNGSCDTTNHAIGALTTGAQSIFTLSGPTQNAFARIYLKAGVSTTTKAHTDYADTLTFIVTGTF